MHLATYCWFGLGLYALLSAADLALTFLLLQSNPAAFESNPVAAVWLERHGWTGLAVFKAAAVLVFVGVVYLLIRRRPAVGAGVVTVGCAALLAVTFYSHGLIQEARAEQASHVLVPADRD